MYEVVKEIQDFGLTLQYPVGATMEDGELPEQLIKSLLKAGVIERAKPKPKASKAKAETKKSETKK